MSSGTTSSVKQLSRSGLAIQLVDIRKPSFCELEFSVAVGVVSEEGGFTALFVARKNFLKAGGQNGFWVQRAGEKRMRNGEPVKNDKGYDVYDPYFEYVFGADKKPTKATYQFFDAVTALAVEARSAVSGESAGRGSGNGGGGGGSGGSGSGERAAPRQGARQQQQQQAPQARQATQERAPVRTAAPTSMESYNDFQPGADAGDDDDLPF